MRSSVMACGIEFLVVLICIVGPFVVNGFEDPFAEILNSRAIFKCNFNKTKILGVRFTKIYMYDFQNDWNVSSFIKNSANEILRCKNFDKARAALVFIPGFSGVIGGPNQEAARQYLKHYPNSYLYIVDHSVYTRKDPRHPILSYTEAVDHYWSIGRAIALWLAEMVEGGVPLQNIIVIGHSLGAHISAAVGEVFLQKTGTKLPQIKGSDPAGPCFSKAAKEYQLRSGLADHVETYHCNAGVYGTDQDLTDAVYYVNGGQQQPECKPRSRLVKNILPNLAAESAMCSHNVCPKVIMLPAKVPGIWKATPCNSKSDFDKGKCAQNVKEIAGIYSPCSNRGRYYFNTNGHTLM